MRTEAATSAVLATLLLGIVSAQSAGWIVIPRDSLCLTEGAIEKTAKDRLSVNVPKMRAYVSAWTAQSSELRFTYLGGTSEQSALGSGAIRRHFGLKLHAQDPCNLVYVMWRIDPESKLVVSVKRNRNEHTSAECGNRGYENIKPRKIADVPHLQPGQSHTLRAEMKNQELRLLVDHHEVWNGDLGAEAAGLDGPIGIRSDNARFEFELRAREFEGVHPNYIKACRTGVADSD